MLDMDITVSKKNILYCPELVPAIIFGIGSIAIGAYLFSAD